jgi:hypothetical protein
MIQPTPATPVTPAAPVYNALTESLAKQSTGYFFGMPEAEEIEKMNNIVVARNGIFRVVNTKIATFTTQIGTMKDGYHVGGYMDMKEDVTLHVPRIPFSIWLKCLSWYKDIHAKDGTEASLLFFWNHNDEVVPTQYDNNQAVHGVTEEGKFIMYCPQQTNSSGLSEFHADGMVKWLRENTTPLLETHSHHTMGAYFSSTDDANENFHQFYAVFGKITSKEPEFAFRFCSGKHKIQVSPWILFEPPVFKVAAQLFVDDQIIDIESAQEYKGPWPKVAYPDDWTAQHKVTYRTVNNYKAPTGELAWQTGKRWDNAVNGYVWPEDHSEKKTSTSQSHMDTRETQNDGKSGRHTDTRGNSGNIIETKSSIVEIISDDIASKYTKEAITKLITHLCDYGYDRFIYEAIEQQA